MVALHFASEFRDPFEKAYLSSYLEILQSNRSTRLCDLLVHEATYLSSYQALADQHLHSTAAGAARTAKKIGAKHLALTHYSARIDVVEASVHEAIRFKKERLHVKMGTV